MHLHIPTILIVVSKSSTSQAVLIETYNMRGLQLIAFLLLFIFEVESQATIPQRQCSNLQVSFPSCNNSVLRVTKSSDMYQVTLLATEWQCYNDFCLLNHERHRQKKILCNETCRACHQLAPEICNGKP